MQIAAPNEINAYFESINLPHIRVEEMVIFDDLQNINLNEPNTYWKLLLILALAFFILEMLIITFWKV
ncbi:hypothetical protein CW751_11530 [Brumimicrobium salinarum]|uniref:Uncharacterized protein n=1 Tax=Brumimicrobium salinarum TaxID=2058658 RepID=A0A2I0R0L6_9FLAO|nr:hypothetical protein [Brumimicrobium salinarum]PKR80128.1 hypothetical protein CW751_11530 [Brumimicrobium salinarum]